MVVKALLYEEHPSPDTVPRDTNVYTFGRMSGHLVVSAGLPSQPLFVTTKAALVQ